MAGRLARAARTVRGAGATRAGRVALLLALIGAGGLVSATQAARQRPGTDFHAKWASGRFFAAGEAVYVLRPDVRGPPTYPPFAAMLFQVLGWFPLKVAAGLFYFANLLLTVAAFALTKRLVERLIPPARRQWGLMVGAGLCTAQFFLNNLNLVQIDTALYVLVLMGVSAYLKGRVARAAVAFVVATAVKLIPVFFVVWLVIRGRRRALVASALAGAACVLLPVGQRGLRQGLADIRDYRTLVLGELATGPAIASYTNQNIGAAIYRLTRPPQKAGDGDYRLLTLSEDAARTARRVAVAAIVVLLVATLAALGVGRAPVSGFELSAVFLTGALASAITWKSHLVVQLFPAAVVLTLPAAGLGRRWRPAWGALVFALVIGGVAGRDLVGDTVHHWLGGYSLFTWTTLALWGAALCLTSPRVRARVGVGAAMPDEQSLGGTHDA